jgi:hypothetical protein
MNNLDIDIALALFTTPNHRFSRLIAERLHFKLGSAELFPNIKPMSSTSKTVVN